MGSGFEDADDEPEIDSDGVYYLSVEDFEWRPKRRRARRRQGQAESAGGRQGADDEAR